MELTNKKIIIGLVVIAAAVAIWYFFIKPKPVLAEPGTAAAATGPDAGKPAGVQGLAAASA